MNRRKFIIISDAIVAVAGCTGDEGDGNGVPANGDEDEPTESAPGSNEGENGTDESNGDDGDAENESEDGERQVEETEEREEDEEQGPHEFSGDDEETVPSSWKPDSPPSSSSTRIAGGSRSTSNRREGAVNCSSTRAIDGSTARGIDSGTYSLSVKADGEWSLSIE